MAFTILDCREITQPLVAIYTDRDETTGYAQPIFGMVVYRDMENKGAENLLVPVTGEDFTSEQSHLEPSRRDVVLRLPKFVICNLPIYNEAAQYGSVDVKQDDDGLWVLA